MPTADARPYGIKVNSQGVIWLCYNGSNKLASINPETMEVREYPVPTPATRIRRLALTSDDTVWYVDFALGLLGRLNPEDRRGENVAVPKRPAVSALRDCRGGRHHLVQRIEPETGCAGPIRSENRKFQSWAIPSRVGLIRHMTVSPDGNLVFHQSSINRIGLVMIGGSN